MPREYPFKPGMEKLGGREVGSRNKLSAVFLKDLLDVYREHGKASLKIMALETPDRFIEVVSRIVPLEAVDPGMIIQVVTGVPRSGERVINHEPHLSTLGSIGSA